MATMACNNAITQLAQFHVSTVAITLQVVQVWLADKCTEIQQW